MMMMMVVWTEPIFLLLALERLYANWRIFVLCVRSLAQTLFLARYDILFWSLRAH
jgi:hypothetical protein